jgi:hypothetical protein
VRLDAEAFSTPSGRTGFRVWLKNHSNGVWRAGERELQDLQWDTANASVEKDVYEITAYGHDDRSGLYFMHDCAFDGEGMEILPDEDGVYWHNGVGYQVAITGSGGQEFRQGSPMMHPGESLMMKDPGPGEWDVEFKLEREEANEKEAVPRLFTELVMRLKDAIGFDAYVVAGWFLGFLGAPEFFKAERCFPGLLAHGETKSGKTTLIEWLMELFGFHNASGIGITSRTSSAVGMLILLEQYSNLPVWVTDYDNNKVAEEKKDVLHEAFNRTGSSKWAAEGQMRKMRTMFVVDGENRPDKTSTRYRYIQILISKITRKGNQVPWMEKNRKFFFTIVRALLRQRKAFAAAMMEEFNQFREKMTSQAQTDRRAIQVHGCAYAAFMVGAKMLGALLPRSEMERFKEFMQQKCQATSDEGEQAANVNQFLADMISAAGRGVFGETKVEKQRFFRAHYEEKEHAPGADSKDEHGNYIQGPWKAYTLYIKLGAVVEVMRKDFAQQRRVMALDVSDLREQMSRRPWWSARNTRTHDGKSYGVKQRFTGDDGAVRCAAIEVDLMPEFGYRHVPDKDYFESYRRRSNPDLPISEMAPPSDWEDPRQGDIYSIVKAVAD